MLSLVALDLLFLFEKAQYAQSRDAKHGYNENNVKQRVSLFKWNPGYNVKDEDEE